MQMLPCQVTGPGTKVLQRSQWAPGLFAVSDFSPKLALLCNSVSPVVIHVDMERTIRKLPLSTLAQEMLLQPTGHLGVFVTLLITRTTKKCA